VPVSSPSPIDRLLQTPKHQKGQTLNRFPRRRRINSLSSAQKAHNSKPISRSHKAETLSTSPSKPLQRQNIKPDSLPPRLAFKTNLHIALLQFVPVRVSRNALRPTRIWPYSLASRGSKMDLSEPREGPEMSSLPTHSGTLSLSSGLFTLSSGLKQQQLRLATVIRIGEKSYVRL
jgi:hypothetical protein